MNTTTTSHVRLVARHHCGAFYGGTDTRCPGCQEPVRVSAGPPLETAARSFADADAEDLFATIERLDLNPWAVAQGFRAEAERQRGSDREENRELARVCDRLAEAIGLHYGPVGRDIPDDHAGWARLEADVLADVHGSSAAADGARLALAAHHLLRAAALLSGSHERHDRYDDKTRVLLVSCWESEAIALRQRAERLAGS